MHGLVHFIRLYGYAGLFGITFLESSFFFPLPGDSLLFTAGLVATRHYLNIYVLIPLFFTATFTGALFGYWIGENIHRLNKYSWFRKLVPEKHLKTVHEFFEKYGKTAILFARFVPIVRTFAPIGAGIGGMKYSDFIKYNIVGAALWSGSMTLTGFYLGRTFPQIQNYLSLIVVLVVIVSTLPGLLHFRKRKNRV